MKERPLLFRGPSAAMMTRKLVKGSKTEIRIPCLDQTAESYCFLHRCETIPGKNRYSGWAKQNSQYPFLMPSKSPLGLVGDRLWLQEEWEPADCSDVSVDVLYTATNDLRPSGISCEDFGSVKTCYCSYAEADKYSARIDILDVLGGDCEPAGEMPKWASRNLSAIIGLWVERLGDMTESHALAEGAESVEHFRDTIWNPTHVGRKRSKKELHFGASPWVWCYEVVNI